MGKAGDDGDGHDGHGAGTEQEAGLNKLELLLGRRKYTREQHKERERKRLEARAALSDDQRKKLDTVIVHLNGIVEAARRLGHTHLYQELEVVVQDIRDAGGS